MATCTELLASLRPRTEEMLAFIGELVAIESGSYDADNVALLGEAYGARWQALGFEARVLPIKGRGPRRSFHRKGEGKGKLVILGHADTVWPAGSQAGWSFSRDAEYAYGPGVGDMRGGLAMAWFAVDALLKLGRKLPAETVMMLVPDEELGSPQSRGWIEDGCRDADAVLVLEPTRPNGGVVTGRRAVGSIRAYYTGRSAHAATNHAEGASAVRAAARATLALEALSDVTRNRVVNVGILRGGAARQVVPHEAEMHVDFRAALPEDVEALETKVKAVLADTGRRSRQRQGGRRLDATRLSGVLQQGAVRARRALRSGNWRADLPGGIEWRFGRELPGLNRQVNARRAWTDLLRDLQPPRADPDRQPGRARGDFRCFSRTGGPRLIPEQADDDGELPSVRGIRRFARTALLVLSDGLDHAFASLLARRGLQGLCRSQRTA